MRIRGLLMTLMFLLAGFPLWAIQATVSHSLFYPSDSNGHSANIVLSWRAAASNLHYTANKSGKWTTTLQCILRWSDSTGTLAEKVFKVNTPERTTVEEARDQIIGDQYSYTMPPGKYTVELILFETKRQSELFQYTDSILVPPFPEDSLRLSSVQLLDTSWEAVADVVYARNNRIDIPLASDFVDDSKSLLHYYFETYHGKKFQGRTGPYFAKIYISTKPYASPVLGYEKADSFHTLSGSEVHYGSFPIEQLGSGNYYLNVVIADRNSWVQDKQCTFFQRFNTRKREQKKVENLAAPTTLEKEPDSNGITHVFDLTTTFVGKYSPVQVKAILRMVSLIADPSENLIINGFLSKPDELYSKYFIYNFWEKRNKKDPGKAWLDYAEKIKEVNRNFSNGRIPGYQTDRGRIYIQYGKPNDRIIVNNENGSLPYEVWQYYSSERNGLDGMFLFYKPARTLIGYQLLHSTFPDEKRNPNWRSFLYLNNLTNGSTNENSQAEQLIGNK